MIYEFVFKDVFLDLKKNLIREEQTNQHVIIHAKLSFPVGKYIFLSGDEEYTAISTKENIMHRAFIVYNPDGTELVRIKEIPLFEKKSVFKELRMVYNEEIFHVKTTFGFKTIMLEKDHKEILTADKISPFLKSLVELYDYKVIVHNTLDLPFVVWVALFKGIHLLLTS